jgi:DNA modification methylase
MDIENRIFTGNSGDVLKTFPGQSADCCVTSPPYFRLRDYGVAGQAGLEDTPGEYLGRLLAVFGETWRVLKDTGTLWVVIGDAYNGSGRGAGIPKKSLFGIPFRFALAMMEQGWILRQDIIWAKPSCMPESVTDRFCRNHEYLFMFSKKPRYYFSHTDALEQAKGYGRKGGNTAGAPARGYMTKPDMTGLTAQHHGNSIRTSPLRLTRGVWEIAPERSGAAHYAVFPEKLVVPCVRCGCPEGGVVLDPFMGSGTTAAVAKKLGRKYAGSEINPAYVKIAERRLAEIDPLPGMTA